MTAWRHFDYAEDDGVATVTFSRPDRLNSLTFDVYSDLRALTAELAGRPSEVRALIIRGTGRGFCSGGDVDEIIGELVEMDTRSVFEFARMTGALTRNLREMPQPVIAAVNGVAAGAGAVLAAAADLRVLAQSSSFRFLFTKVGISGGDMGICWLLPRIVGLGRATQMLMLGEKITADEALRAGLATQVVPDDELHAVVAEFADKVKSLAPWGLQMTKEMLNRAASADYSTAIEMEVWTQTMLMTSADFRAFHAGFTSGHEPAFTGR